MFKIELDNINGKNDTLYVYGDNSILTELEEHNVMLNYACRQGHCGNCILRLLSGEVIHKDALISLSRGEILACRAIPISHIKIGHKAL